MGFEAVIFDMDGVIINSEHLWRKAMIRGFDHFSMPISEEECRRTMGMRFKEVIQRWLNKHPGVRAAVPEIEHHVLDLLIGLIEQEGEFIPGIPESIAVCAEHKKSMGLATSSSNRLMKAVLGKLGIENLFHAAVSAETLRYGKPHPEVFLLCAEQLKAEPGQCLVIEDSLNGVIAGKAAGMKVVAVPDDEHTTLQQFAIADHHLENMLQLPALLSSLFSIRQNPARR